MGGEWPRLGQASLEGPVGVLLRGCTCRTMPLRVARGRRVGQVGAPLVVEHELGGGVHVAVGLRRDALLRVLGAARGAARLAVLARDRRPVAAVEAAARPYELVPAGRPIGDPQPMFSKIGNDQVEELRQRYSGQQQDSAAEEAAAAASEKKKEEKKRKKEEKKQKKAAAAAAAAPDGDASSVALTKENSS